MHTLSQILISSIFSIIERVDDIILTLNLVRIIILVLLQDYSYNDYIIRGKCSLLAISIKK